MQQIQNDRAWRAKGGAAAWVPDRTEATPISSDGKVKGQNLRKRLHQKQSVTPQPFSYMCKTCACTCLSDSVHKTDSSPATTRQQLLDSLFWYRQMLNSLYVFKRPINIFHPFEHHFLASKANKSSQTCIINALDALHPRLHLFTVAVSPNINCRIDHPAHQGSSEFCS